MDIARIREETPACHRAVHLNAAGASLTPRPVLDAVLAHLNLEAEIGGYEASDTVQDRLEHGYTVLAALINARPTEIAFTDSATRAWDMAFYSIPFRAGERILTTTSEYSSNALAYIQAARRHDVQVEVVPDDEHGTISLDTLEKSLAQGNVRLVAVNHIPTHDGLINPAKEIGALAKAHGALFLLDACQSAGHLALDVQELGCDFLSATGRKFMRGPRGTGFLYVREEVLPQLDPMTIELRSADLTGPSTFTLRPDARRFESWEKSVATQLGLIRAAEYALEIGMDAIERRVLDLGKRLRDGLELIPDVTVRDRGRHKSGVVTFHHARLPAYELFDRLKGDGVVARVSEQTFRYDEGPTPPPRVRASMHYYNTEDEIDHTLGVLKKY